MTVKLNSILLYPTQQKKIIQSMWYEMVKNKLQLKEDYLN